VSFRFCESFYRLKANIIKLKQLSYGSVCTAWKKRLRNIFISVYGLTCKDTKKSRDKMYEKEIREYLESKKIEVNSSAQIVIPSWVHN